MIAGQLYYFASEKLPICAVEPYETRCWNREEKMDNYNVNGKKVLLTSGPSTTTETVRGALMVPDISPRNKEVADIINDTRECFVEIGHGDQDYVAVPLCGSGTLCMDVCLNSLVNKGKVLILENGQYSRRAVGICDHYHIPFIRVQFPYTEELDLTVAEQILQNNPEVEVVYSTHQESETGIINPIREIGRLAHKYNAISIVDTLSTYGLIPINLLEDNIDFCMGAAHKGISSFVGFSYVVGKKELIEKSKHYPSRSFYANLYMEYESFRDNGIMKFTPPVPLVYSVYQGVKEYREEGEIGKYNRHLEVKRIFLSGLKKLGFELLVKEELQSGLIISWKMPSNPEWDYKKIYEYCLSQNFEIFPTPIQGGKGFRLACFGAADASDAERFVSVFADALRSLNIQIPVQY